MSSLDRYDPNRPGRLIASAAGPADEVPEAPVYEPQVKDIRDIIAVLWKYKLLISVVFAACVLVGAFFTTHQKPIYRATAKILVDTGTPTAPTSGQGFGMIAEMLNAGRSRSIQTQVVVLQSYPILEDAMRRLNRKLDPVKMPSVKAQNIRDTDIIQISVEDPDRKFARDLANSVAYAYIARSQRANRLAATKTREFLEDAIRRQKRALDEAEARLKAYKERVGIASITEEVTNRVRRLAAAEEELASARTQVQSLSGELKVVEDLLSKAEQTYVRESTSAANPLIASMKSQIAALEIQRAGLLKEYQPDTPEVQAVDEQIAKAQATLQEELRRSMVASGQTIAANPIRMDLIQRAGTLRAQLMAQQARINALQPMIQAEKQSVSALPSRERGIVALTREVANLEKAYTELNSKYQEVAVAEQAKLASATLEEPALLPLKPVRPKPALNLALAAVIGLMLGTMLAFLLDHLDDTVKGTEDVDRHVGLPTLGVIPALPKSTKPILIMPNDRSMVAESFRLLRSNIRFASPDKPLRALMVTSSGAGEGKTTIAANLAVALASNGMRVILADLDLRRPAIASRFGIKRGKGLTNVVLGDLSVEEALVDSGVENLRVLLGGPLPPNPPEFLDSERCRKVLESLKDMADIVIYDTPPASFLTDGMILCSQADGVLIVANPGRTVRHALRRVVDQILLAKGRILGVCLNRMQAGGRDGYYYYYSYYYRYYHYYESDGDGGSGLPNRKAGFLRRMLGVGRKTNGEAQASGPDSRSDDEQQLT
ncbi:MAG: GumC family protein [Armatimonadota bacterium]